MTTVLVIGDPHFKVCNAPESKQMVEKLLIEAKRLQPTFIVCLGDILHKHETIHVSPLMAAEEMIRLLSEVAPTYLIIGNHDRPNNSNYLTSEHPFNAMKQWPNTFIVDKVVDTTIDNMRFLLVPYVPPGRFMDALNTVENPLNVSAIFAHQEFYNAKMGAILSQAGDKWSINNPLVISGHVHDYDKLQSNLIYVGTPMQHAFGDSVDKTVSKYNFHIDDGNNFVWTEERIDLGLIKKVIIYLTPDKIHTYEPPIGKLVKLVIKGDEGQLKAVSQLEKIKELKSKNVRVVFKLITNKNESKPYKKIRLKLRFRDRLYSSISKDPDQLKCFNTIFPT